jgi:hypothetical protein
MKFPEELRFQHADGAELATRAIAAMRNFGVVIAGLGVLLLLAWVGSAIGIGRHDSRHGYVLVLIGGAVLTLSGAMLAVGARAWGSRHARNRSTSRPDT